MLAALIGLLNFVAVDLKSSVMTNVATPLLDSMLIIIPAGVAIAGLHKVMEHRESGGAFLVEMITKAGGAFVLIQLVKALFQV